jgi:hypothetical protein
MKAFFQRWGLEAPEDAPLPFRIPGSNVQRTWQISPLPPSEAELSDLAKSLFQQFAHPLENLQLRFDFYETAV